MGNATLHGFGQPCNQSQFVEEVRHHDQGGKPDDGVPRAFFFQRVVPSQYAGEQAQAQTEEGGGGGIDFHAEQHFGNARPQKQQNHENAEHDFFVTLHRAHFFQFFFGKGGRVRRLFDFGRIQEIQHQRHQEHSNQAGDDHGGEPCAPREVDLRIGGFGDQFDDQRVGRGRGNEDAAGDDVGVVVDQREVFTDFAFRAFFGVGIETQGDGTHNRMHDGAAARGVARRNRTDDQVRQSQAVTYAQRAFAEKGNQQVADTHPQAGFQQTARDDDGDTDHPD